MNAGDKTGPSNTLSSARSPADGPSKSEGKIAAAEIKPKETAADGLNETMGELMQQLSALKADMVELSDRLATDVRHSGEVAGQEIIGQIQRNPLAAVGIAFGAGYLCALLRRR